MKEGKQKLKMACYSSHIAYSNHLGYFEVQSSSKSSSGNEKEIDI